MFAIPTRRRNRLAATSVGVLLSLGLLAGCMGQQIPGSYGDGVRRDFVEGCAATLVRDRHPDDTRGDDGALLDLAELRSSFGQEIGAYETQCGCVYDRFEADVPYDDFRQAHEDLTEAPAALDDYDEFYEDCELGRTTET